MEVVISSSGRLPPPAISIYPLVRSAVPDPVMTEPAQRPAISCFLLLSADDLQRYVRNEYVKCLFLPICGCLVAVQQKFLRNPPFFPLGVCNLFTLPNILI